MLTRPGTATRRPRKTSRGGPVLGTTALPTVRVNQSATLAPAPHGFPPPPTGRVPTSDGQYSVTSAWPILSFNAPRLLPVKAVLRVVAEVAKAEAEPWVSLGELRSRLGVIGLGWRASLEALDGQRDPGRGERLATGFPSASRDGERSVRRFLDSNLGAFYSDGRVVGAPAHLGFLDLVKGEQGEKVVLTPAGLSFAQLRNSVLDGQEARFPPFTTEETDFYVRHVARARPAEAEHMREYMLLLSQRPGVGRDAASAAMRRFYVRFWPPNELTPDMVGSLRMAVHSRCQELGLAVAEHLGHSAKYRISELGERTLGLLQSSKASSDGVTR